MKVFKKITAGLCFAVLILGLGYHSFVNMYYNSIMCGNVLRLHVVANSDTDEDIALKNTVAAAINQHVQELFSGCDSFEKAKMTAQESTEDLKRIAQRVLDENGSCQAVRVVVGQKDYETRVLDSVTYPEGKYCSVRIILGKGQGHNWWCVLFSPLTDVGIQKEQGGQKGTKIKFKIFELFE